jgi:hypothetical protein
VSCRFKHKIRKIFQPVIGFVAKFKKNNPLDFRIDARYINQTFGKGFNATVALFVPCNADCQSATNLMGTARATNLRHT